MLKCHESWNSFIKNSKHLNKMLSFVDKESNICPLKDNVFRFLDSDLSNIKCVLLGMDPYPSTYKDNEVELPVATGRSFEVANVELWTDKYKQSSLSQIFKTLAYMRFGKKLTIDELRNCDEIRKWRYINIHDWFDAMEKEGVLFLNATLTTVVGESGAHVNLWKDFMDELIDFIVSNNSGIKWLIWGKDALDRVSSKVSNDNIIYTCHPATRMNNTFIDDCCFRKVGDIKWI